MDDAQLKRYLQSVGMECFVTYYRRFADYSLSNEDVAAILVNEMKYASKASRARVSTARSIIKAGLARDALIIISKSVRVPASVKDEADGIAT